MSKDRARKHKNTKPLKNKDLQTPKQFPNHAILADNHFLTKKTPGPAGHQNHLDNMQAVHQIDYNLSNRN